jgi:HEAT repeat protein
MQKVADRLAVPLFDDGFRGWYHTHVANCLATAAHCMAPYEDFDGIYQIAQNLEKSRLRNPQLHKDCCGEALGNLLGPRSIERLVELYSLRRYGQRMVVSILRLMGRLGAEKIFQRLEEEKVASNRLALIRLIGQMGLVAHDVARGKLRDERWYVVRNACHVLMETQDPEIIQDMRETLRHQDERVQEAAFQVITKSKAPGRPAALADALPQLKPHVLEEVLKELRFMKSPEGVPGLEAFITLHEEKLREREEAMHALAAVPEDASADALARILRNEKNPPSVRRIAIKALGKSNLSVAYQALAEVASRVPNDPMARESQAALEIE